MLGQGVTPLMNAVKHKNLDLVKMLIRSKANMDLTSQTNVRAQAGLRLFVDGDKPHSFYIPPCGAGTGHRCFVSGGE